MPDRDHDDGPDGAQDPVTFLLVDDLPANLDALEALLRRDGLRLLRAASGTEALEILLAEGGGIALALVDVQMPGMDGLELAELMRGAARTRDIPLVLVTAGGADAARRFRGYEAGAVDFLDKPVDPHTLRQKADVFFRLERQRRALRRQRDALAATEAARAASEARFRALVAAMPQIAFAAPPDGRTDFVNARWTEYSGQSAERALDGGWAEALHPGDRERVLATWGRAVAAGEPCEFEQRLRAADGTHRWFLARAEPLREEGTGRVLRWFGTCTDISAIVAAREERARRAEELERLVEERTAQLLRAAEDRRLAEEASRQAEKLAALGQLVGGVAHDFNNLLQVVSGGVALLGGDPSAERRATVLAHMGRAVEASRDLVARLLAFARHQPLRPETVELREHLGATAGLLQQTLGGRVQVALDLAPGLWPARCDRGQLDVALLNLALNARDAMEPQGGTLAITADNAPLLEAEGELPAGDYVRVVVRDTGAGMPPAVLRRIFEPFFTTKEVGRGTGLGLPQVFGFARQSGGALRVDSEPGRGTAVELRLPRAQAAAPAGSAPPQRAGGCEESAALRDSAGRTVLVVEDNEAAGDFAARLLEDLGYRALRADSGARAMEMLAAGLRPDIVFSDVVMPGGVNGAALATALRADMPGVAVLLATSYSGSLLAGEGLPEGIEVLRKPYGAAELAAGLRRALAAAGTPARGTGRSDAPVAPPRATGAPAPASLRRDGQDTEAALACHHHGEEGDHPGRLPDVS